MEKELKDVKKLIKTYEKNKSLPEKIVERYKRNLYAVGEFAINTNPNVLVVPQQFGIRERKMSKYDCESRIFIIHILRDLQFVN